MFPNRPVFLKRIDGHAALVNQTALDIAGINASTKVNGGSIELQNGKPTGILIDNAMDIVENKIPLLYDSLAKKYYQAAQEQCFALGLTGVQDCGISEHTVDMVDAEQKAGRLKMKIFALLSDSAAYYDRWIAKGPYKPNAFMWEDLNCMLTERSDQEAPASYTSTQIRKGGQVFYSVHSTIIRT